MRLIRNRHSGGSCKYNPDTFMRRKTILNSKIFSSFFFLKKFIFEWKGFSAGRNNTVLLTSVELLWLTRFTAENAIQNLNFYCIFFFPHEKRKQIGPFWRKQQNHKKQQIFSSLFRNHLDRRCVFFYLFTSNMPKTLSTTSWRALCTCGAWRLAFLIIRGTFEK